MDFTQLTSIPVEGTDVTLCPLYDRVLRTFCVNIRTSGKIFPLGLDAAFSHADEVLEAIDEALAAVGVRELTGDEAGLLYLGLLKARGGADWQLFCLTPDEAEQA
ncbi:hypothetical protein ACIGD1_34540 [Streptomyces sp. NPDC085612]|uniref:hypothetical protein n=1 Tax=Streptomyces sp. NPDC085612 TaxID=3365732 RepID=UPI0037D5235E